MEVLVWEPIDSGTKQFEEIAKASADQSNFAYCSGCMDARTPEEKARDEIRYAKEAEELEKAEKILESLPNETRRAMELLIEQAQEGC